MCWSIPSGRKNGPHKARTTTPPPSHQPSAASAFNTDLIPIQRAGGRIGRRQITDVIVLLQHLIVAIVRIDQLLLVGNGLPDTGAARRHDGFQGNALGTTSLRQDSACTPTGFTRVPRPTGRSLESGRTLLLSLGLIDRRK